MRFRKFQILSEMSTEPVQSPISLQLRNAEFQDDAVPLEYFGHWEKVGGFAEMINTGSSAMITFPNRNKKAYIVGGPLKDKYIFEQIHFHWVCSSSHFSKFFFCSQQCFSFLSLIKGDCNDFGCEHLLDGNTYSMEGHLVHYNSKYKNFQEAVDKPDGLAVTGFLIQAAGSKDCEEFKKISDGIEFVQKPNSTTRLAGDCLSFLKLQELNKHYYRYRFPLVMSIYLVA